MGNQKTFDVKSVMDVLYGDENPRQCYSGFIFADEGTQKASDDEVIPFPEEDKDYSTFWNKKS